MEKKATIMNKEQEIEKFMEAMGASHKAEQQIVVLSADLFRHIESLQSGGVARTSEMQATLSSELVEEIIDELKKANDALSSFTAEIW